jgi:transposase
MEQVKRSTKCGGVDVSKASLDVAAHGLEETIKVANGPDGFAELARWCRSHGLNRIGLEATGGYERALVSWLQGQGFEVVVHQPLEIRLFARLRRRRAKNDRIDAKLIAAATAQVDAVKAAADPRLADLAERMTAYEQASDMLAQLKTFLEHVHLPDLRAGYEAEARRLMAWKKTLLADLVKRIKGHADLKDRYELLRSLPGAGPVVAASLVVRMPELGSLQRGQAAALIGVAPFDHDTGQHKGQRHIAGGRARPRRLLYLAALAAKRCEPGFRTMAHRLKAAGKAPKLIVVAVMRKLIELANLVLRRATPWVPQPAPSSLT